VDVILVSTDTRGHMIAAKRIASILGGEPVLKRRVRSLTDLQRAVAEGLPKATLERTVRYVLPDRGEARRVIDRIIPPATFKRRKAVLKPEESEKVERLARVIATAEEVWDDREDARRFLTSPHPLLQDQRPLDVAQTELGARRVEELLWQIVHGLPV
jgi:putative toxin-antitoxin system antitoxin component (TIGR02293 family)